MKHDITDFETQVLARSRQVPVLCDFWAPWCGPCIMFAPLLEKLAANAGGRWELAKLNVEEHAQVANRFRISGIPAIKLFHNGTAIAESVGMMDESRLRKWLESNLPGGGCQSAMNAFPPLAGEEPAGMSRRVAVLGASSNPQRYSHMAIVLLKEKGFPVVPVHPALPEILGLPVVKRLADIRHEIHTLTLYVAAKHLPPLTDEILRMSPRRVIFNPGTESIEVIEALSHSGIECVEGCTLVMLKTGQF